MEGDDHVANLSTSGAGGDSGGGEEGGDGKRRAKRAASLRVLRPAGNKVPHRIRYSKRESLK